MGMPPLQFLVEGHISPISRLDVISHAEDCIVTIKCVCFAVILGHMFYSNSPKLCNLLYVTSCLISKLDRVYLSVQLQNHLSANSYPQLRGQLSFRLEVLNCAIMYFLSCLAYNKNNNLHIMLEYPSCPCNSDVQDLLNEVSQALVTC